MKINKGTITPALLIITSAFIIVIYGLIMVLTTQIEFSHRQIGSEMSLHIAEAGVNYYRWHLSHTPTDFQDGTNTTGPYVHSYKDPQGQEIGKYSLDIAAPTNGSTIITIKSTGWSNRYPNVKRTIVAKLGKPSLAKYLFLSNASAWYAEGITVNGNIHSNNGIRMDGINTGIVESTQTDYMCGNETGCAPPNREPGVWGSGPNSDLWKFPVPAIDFYSVSVNFATMKTNAQETGLYLPPSNVLGYHLVFSGDGTFTVKKVTATSYIYSYLPPGEGLGSNGQGGCRKRYETITSEQTVGTYNVSAKSIIFSEDYLWVDGVVKGRTTIVAAGFPVQSSTLDIWINGNITYPTLDGTNVLGLIAQNDIIFKRDVPDNFVIDAILMAQGGQIIRPDYAEFCQGTTNGAIKNSYTLNGSFISYYKSYYNYNSPLESGFITRTINYDANVLFQPPPYFPTSSDFRIISWAEQ